MAKSLHSSQLLWCSPYNFTHPTNLPEWQMKHTETDRVPSIFHSFFSNQNIFLLSRLHCFILSHYRFLQSHISRQSGHQEAFKCARNSMYVCARPCVCMCKCKSRLIGWRQMSRFILIIQTDRWRSDCYKPNLFFASLSTAPHPTPPSLSRSVPPAHTYIYSDTETLNTWANELRFNQSHVFSGVLFPLHTLILLDN